MPIVWRYLLGQYTKVLCLAICTFIAVLFVFRLRQIAQFAAMGAGMGQILMFALFLIPYVLPLAVPIACLIASILLYQRLSYSNELTALRTSGMALRHITTPILVMAAGLAILNFSISSELATHCHMLGKKMQSANSKINPLHMLQNTQLLRFRDTHVDMRTVVSGEVVEDVNIVMATPKTDRLTAMHCDRLLFDGKKLWGQGVGLVTTMASKAEDGGYDHLFIENETEMWAPKEAFSHVLKQMNFVPKNSHLRLSLLLKKIKTNRADSSREISEIFRRVSLGLAAFTMTLMGCAFGMEIGRHRRKRGVVYGLLLSAFFIICFVAANSMEDHLVESITLYLLPHFVITPLCVWNMRRTTRGVE